MLQCVVDTQTHKNSLYYIKRANERQFLSKETQIPFIFKMPFYEKSPIFYQKRYSIKGALYSIAEPYIKRSKHYILSCSQSPEFDQKSPIFRFKKHSDLLQERCILWIIYCFDMHCFDMCCFEMFCIIIRWELIAPHSMQPPLYSI